MNLSGRRNRAYMSGILERRLLSHPAQDRTKVQMV